MSNTTIQDVAEEADVSVATVSHVINGTRYVSPELTARVETVMEKLDYQRNAVARGLKTQATHTIGLLISDISNPFFSSLMRGAEGVAADKGYSIIVSNTDETLEKEELYIDVFRQRQTDGLIIAPTGKDDNKIKKLNEDNIPFVFVDRKMEKVSAPSVLSENVQGAKKATKHLIQKGHSNIGLVGGLCSVTTTRERIEGYKESLKNHEIPVNEDLIVYGNSQVQGGFEAANTLLQLNQPPTAIFSTNNLMTIGVMKSIKQKGLRCPEDIALIGFDDFEWASSFEPTLTTVAQDPYQIGKKAAEILFDCLANEESITDDFRLPPKLIVRNSTTTRN